MDLTMFWHWVCNLFKETETFWSWFTTDIVAEGSVLEEILNHFGVDNLTPLWLITFGIGGIIIAKLIALFL